MLEILNQVQNDSLDVGLRPIIHKNYRKTVEINVDGDTS